MPTPPSSRFALLTRRLTRSLRHSLRHSLRRPVRRPIARATLGVAAIMLGCAGLAQAEKADRVRPMLLESEKGCVANLAKQTNVCSGNVVLTQGTLVIRGDRIELRETADGYRLASALGTPAKPAQYREKREGVDEFVEGTAQRIDYDGRAATLRFDGQALVKRLRGGTVADEIHGSVIVWDSTVEQFSVLPGAANAANPSGRVRAILAPSPAAVSAAAAASAAAPSSSSGASTPALRSSPTLGDRR